MARGGSRLEYFFGRVQEAGVGLFNAAKGGNLGGGECRVKLVVRISESRAFPNPS